MGKKLEHTFQEKGGMDCTNIQVYWCEEDEYETYQECNIK
jgi:hypothetical protein